MKWNTLIHNGVYFPPPYKPLPPNVKLFYNGAPVSLNPEQEEPAYLYARYIGTEYTENKTFNKNFWQDWKSILGKDSVIKDWNLINFQQLVSYIQKQREEKANIPKEEKDRIKEERNKILEKYKKCVIDGVEQPVGNFIIEPPELFKGRGKHPLTGSLKPRIHPGDITINISKGVEIPKPNIPGEWGEVIEDKDVLWLACWKDKISGKTKYVFIGQDSELRMSKDMEKFEKARKLKTKIKKIRDVYLADLVAQDLKTRQIATAVYLIDLLALRVGNEKGEDEAETVGVTSLKIKNVGVTKENILDLDFLGKDSIRYTRSVCINTEVYSNIKTFILDKQEADELFDLITSADVNKYLQDLMKGLTAKVFRTFNASYVFQRELNKIKEGQDEKVILHYYNMANKEVADLCNHQKKISKNFKDQIKKIEDTIKKLSKKDNKTDKQKARIKELKDKKKLKVELKNLSLGTSKVNYIDPRITIAFMKKHNIPVEKVMTASVLKKFTWALDVNKDWQF